MVVGVTLATIALLRSRKKKGEPSFVDPGRLRHALEDAIEDPERRKLALDVVDVMKEIKRQQKTRKLILLGSSVIGGLFGVVGATLLSDPIAGLVAQLAAGDAALPLGLAVMSAVALLAWLVQDETRMTV